MMFCRSTTPLPTVLRRVTQRHGSRSGHQRWSSSSAVVVALVRNLSDSFVDAISSSPDAVDVHHAVACEQHAQYCRTLQQIPNVTVQYLPDLHDQPDACFVEDTAVVVGRKAVVLRLGHVDRRPEVESVATALRNLHHLEIVADMRDEDGTNATCDGGDILRVGHFLFCGRSGRTTDAGIDVLADAFGATHEVVGVDPTPGFLHLKSVATALTDDAVLLFQHATTDSLAHLFQSKGLRVYPVWDSLACNVVAINQTIVAQETMDAASLRSLERAASDNALDLVHVDTSELAKKDAALTCCSIIVEEGKD